MTDTDRHSGEGVRESSAIYDPFFHTSAFDPYPLYAALRDNHPLYRNDERDCWVLSRFADVQSAARDWQAFSNAGGVELGLPPHYLGSGDFLDLDPPPHDRIRKAVQNRFQPRNVAGLEPWIRTQVASLLHDFRGRRSGDAAWHIALQLPMLTMFHVMGIPDADRKTVRRWLVDYAERTPGSSEIPVVSLDARRNLVDYFATLLGAKRARPSDDLMSTIVAAEAKGDIFPGEPVGICMLLLIAGWETTAALITNSLFNLWRFPEQRRILVGNPKLMPGAVEELLRFEAPVQHLQRTLTCPVMLHGQLLPAESRVILLWAAANHDEGRWTEPGRLDVLRKPLRHLAFGDGVHFCLGASLARLEAQAMLEGILAVSPNYEVTGDVERLSSHVLRAIRRLEVDLD